MYLVQFKSEPRFRFERVSRFYVDLVFDFLLAKIKFDGFEDSAATTINILNNTDVLQGPPEIVCKCWSVKICSHMLSQSKWNNIWYFCMITDATDFLGGTHFCLHYKNGYKFETASYVKENFVEQAVAFLQNNLKMEWTVVSC